MDNRAYYAHSLDGRPVHEWQRLEDHLRAVADRASQFAAPFQSADWGWNAGWLHDIGKLAIEFQTYMARENGLDDTEYDGSAVAVRRVRSAILLFQCLG